MGVRRFQDLVAWQLSHELKCEVMAFTDALPAARDFKYCDPVREASASAPATIAEGFGRVRPRDFARFPESARASLIETENHLIDGRDRGYLDARLHSRLTHLTRVAITATTNLLRSKQRQADQQSRRADRRPSPPSPIAAQRRPKRH